MGENNFGLEGQSGYDHFLCLTKKCKERKAAKHKARIERKELKNDQRRAETESLRAETALLKNTGSSSSQHPQNTGTPQIIYQQAPPSPPQKNQGMGIIMVFVGILVVGGAVAIGLRGKLKQSN